MKTILQISYFPDLVLKIFKPENNKNTDKKKSALSNN